MAVAASRGRAATGSARGWVVALLLAGLAALLLLLVVLNQLARQQQSATHWVNHTLKVLGAASTLQADLATAASEARGYMVDRSAESIRRTDIAVQQTNGDLTRLRALTADNPQQRRAIDRLGVLIDERLAVLRDVIGRLRSGDEAGAARTIGTNRGRTLMDQATAQIDEVRSEEASLLDHRRQDEQRAAEVTLSSLMGCALVIVASLGTTMALLILRRHERDHVAQLRVVNADLELRVRARTGELAAALVQLDTLFRWSSDALFIVRVEGEAIFRYERLNPAGARLTGLSAEGIAGKTPQESLPAAAAAAALHQWRRCVQERRPIEYSTTADLPGGRRDWEVALAPVLDGSMLDGSMLDGSMLDGSMLDGSMLDGSVLDGSVLDGSVLDGSGPGHCAKVRLLVGSARDVTIRHKADAATKASEARYRLLADHTTDVIMCLDLQFRPTYVSPAYLVTFGHDPDAVVGQSLAASLHPDDVEATFARLHQLASGAVDRELSTHRMRHRDGHFVWVEANLGVVRDEASRQPVSIVCTIRDVSERRILDEERRTASAELERLARHLTRERDRAERASRAKSRFLAGMSHELRTPLNGILGYAQLLRSEDELTAVQKARVDAMLGAGTHLLDMINRVLDLSEIEAERVALKMVRIDLHQVAAACLDLVRTMTRAKGLALTLSMAPDTPRHLVTDATRLRQVLLNLLGNAVKFTARGAVEMRLEPAASGTMMRIGVADTGPGIAAEKRHRLFQDFERLDSGGSGPIEGAGLGLALSIRLASMMGGHLSHEDNPEGGSIFWLDLPLLTTVEQAPGGPALQGEPPAIYSGGVLRVLVVDDVAMNRDIAAAFVRAGGHEVTCVEGGAEAVTAVAEAAFDVVLMDVLMPGVDGLEAARRIRALPGGCRRVPIIAFTAQAFAEQVEECRRAGMDGHLAKPFTQAALLQTLAQAAAAGRVQADAVGPSWPPILPAAPPPAWALPAFDETAFERIAAFLTPQAVSSYMQAIAERGEALLRLLGMPGAYTRGADGVAAAAHTLAGSAAMLGFQRLAVLARDFEHAARTDAPETRALAADLSAAVEVSLSEIERRTPKQHAEPSEIGASAQHAV